MGYIWLLLLATALSYPAGLAIGQYWLLPILNAAPAYIVLLRLLRQGNRRDAVRAVLLWAATLALFGTLTFTFWPGEPGTLVIRGQEYRDEMFLWIRTGQGSEGSARAFLPQHILELAFFVIMSLGTASALSVVMGAALMNYMAFYVASLARNGVPAWAVILLGWQPWAICRIAAFCTLGAILPHPLLSRLFHFPAPGPAKRYLIWSGAGILLDWVLKATLAPLWGFWLRRLLQ